ncbi:hypothetical protein M434DRAFT_81723 [Hypoxylon sp. CO27-5]|nr:hypothetical protein M434DRAFT_81723 [Hypoxylon sp. CO27-5]
MDANNPNTPLLIRRNGRPQACDPCRKRKLACDHTQPVCSRCKKRKQDADCVYIVSGSKTPGPASPLPSPAPSTSSAAARHRNSQPVQSPLTVRSDIQVPSLARPGYLGPTSYCDIYEDTENSLSLLPGPETSTPQSENVSHHAPVGGSQNVMSPRVRDMCLTVLRNIPSATQGSMLRFKPGSDGWIRPVALEAVKSLYNTFKDYFGVNRSTTKLEELARIICTNTSKPFSDDETDPQRWTSQFIGENMRWEIIGLLSVFWDFVPGSDAAANWKGRRSAEFERGFSISRENLQLCFELCKESHAESISLLTFLGFHAVEERNRHQASVSNEVKKRLFHHLFTMAMVVVSFTGRPPLIASRYSSTPLPFDLSDEVIFSDNETFMKAVERLDERGWNTDGEIYPSTRIRARTMIAAIREELFEIALANEQVASVETLLKLRARELQTISEFPVCLHFDPTDLENPEVSITTLSSRLFVQLEHLQNMFFIERLLLRNGHEDKGDLLKVSYELVTLTLPWYSNNHIKVMAYAVPAGGILCLELLRPTLHIRPHSDPRITRSNIIQKLSLLVAYLNWVSPWGPNGDLCNDAKSVIQRVLDRALNAASSVYEPPAVLEWDFSTQLDFNFDLLDTFDWNRPDFPPSQQSNQ